MKKRTRRIILLLIIFSVLLYGTYQRVILPRRSVEKNQTQDLLMTVEKGDIRRQISGTGTLKPQREKNLSFPLSGEIETVNIKEGAIVSEGDLLISLEDTQQQLSLLRAQNTLDSVLGIGPASQIREQELNVKAAERALAATKIFASFDGLITTVNVKEGNFVSPGQILARLIDTSQYQVKIFVDEVDSHLIALNQTALITFDAIPNQTFQGFVSKIGFETQSTGGIVTIAVDIDLLTTHHQFRPGFSSEVEIIIDEKIDKLIIPTTAVFIENNTEYVARYENGELTPQEITTGLSDGIFMEVIAGLAEKDQILINAYSFAGFQPANPFFSPMMRR